MGSLKYFEISVLRHIRFAELRKTINRTITVNKSICNLTPEVCDLLKYCGKEENFLFFSIIFCYFLLDFYVKTGTKFSPRDKRLFKTIVPWATGEICRCYATFFQFCQCN